MTTLQSILNELTNSPQTAQGKIYEITLNKEEYIPMFGNVTKFKCRFFVGTNGFFCIQPLRRKRSGYRCGLTNEEILSLVEVGDEKTPKSYDVMQNAQLLLKKIHGFAWRELKEKLQKAVDENNPELLSSEYMLMGKVKYRNIVKDIEKYDSYSKTEILAGIKKAFDSCEEYRWSHNTYRHTGRDLSLSVKPQPDGSVLAWFQSEFMGCGNGDYYLLINPTTAIFCERD